MKEQEQIEGIRELMKLLDKCVSLNPMCKAEVATVVYGNNYRKINEDSIVLSREEYIDLSRNYVGEQVAQARKETAEKIFKMLISKLESNQFLSGKRISMDVDVENLAKQFGVEIEEL